VARQEVSGAAVLRHQSPIYLLAVRPSIDLGFQVCAVLNILAPQLAGTFRLAPWKFFAIDTTAVLLWASSYMAMGWVFRSQLESVSPLLQRVGVFVALALIVAVGALILRRRTGGASARHLAVR
jgi:membrane protein DedA with SNARE-associated domain